LIPVLYPGAIASERLFFADASRPFLRAAFFSRSTTIRNTFLDEVE
jgi:hypothetical protein